MFGVAEPGVEQAVRTYVKLLRASKAVLAGIEPLLAAEGLTVTQLGVLEALLHKGSLTHRELGRKVLTSAGNVTDVVDKLERRGLVVRRRCAEDRRSVHVCLTDCGRERIQAVFPRHAADIARVLGGLDAEEQRQLGLLLRKLGQGAERAGLAPAEASAHLCGQSFDIEQIAESNTP